MEKGKLQLKHIEKLQSYGITIADKDEIELLRYKPGEEILRQGFPMEYLLFVISGRAKVYGSATNGRDLLLSYYVGEGIMGDIELMMEEYSATTTAIALTELICIALPFSIWANRLRSNIVFLNCVGQELANKLIQCSNKGVTTALHVGEERLCTYILQTAINGLLDEKLTNVASGLGMSYRHMLRMLKRLCDENILKKEEKGYRVVDKKGLRSKSFIEE